jgi:hypothetical protein
MRTLKEMIVNNQKVRFSRYRDGNLWYETECGFRFPVLIAEAGTGTLAAEDRALLFMRSFGDRSRHRGAAKFTWIQKSSRGASGKVTSRDSFSRQRSSRGSTSVTTSRILPVWESFR